jgi:hypothetical protein
MRIGAGFRFFGDAWGEGVGRIGGKRVISGGIGFSSVPFFRACPHAYAWRFGCSTTVPHGAHGGSDAGGFAVEF